MVLIYICCIIVCVQAEIFSEISGVSGLVVTKLDGSAKGGVVVALAEKFKLPI